MITYSDIYEIARKERYSEQLQKLAKKFVLDVANYLREKKEFSEKESEVFSDVVVKTKKQLENAQTIFRELMLRRRKKILSLVLIASETGISKQDFENMLDFEKELFEELVGNVKNSELKLGAILNGKQEETNNELVLFRENVGEFVNLDGKKMGPFEKGQVANLPKEIVKILKEDGKVQGLDI